MNHSSHLYIDLSKEIHKYIQNKLSKGEFLLSERKLAVKYDVSRTTVRLALQRLDKLGVIMNVPAKGWLVTGFDEGSFNLKGMVSFSENMLALGKVPSDRIIESEHSVQDSQIMKKFETNQESFIKFVRLRLADETPLLLETTYLPESIFGGFEAARLQTESMYDLFRDEYSQVISHSVEEISAEIINKEEAELLDLPKETAILLVEQKTYNNQNKIIEYTISKFRSDKFKYKTMYSNV
ncbi:GntR family transcriptional regulator [Facklamia sp. DSM 111018]|uniref:GntR family transcriptional regulator n=1 Tax=Facklamia lactis TaxID=2749967 RepID=A0ABS0LQM7_9LACT|nr:GntR family transcriptional regulator [Facklamia lactis]MBG9979546.1 GntR family transcriptional regulator [Facklamia lactis]MBG9985785.1 GntR family transcriptional regulator [Facklamia lactis]